MGVKRSKVLCLDGGRQDTRLWKIPRGNGKTDRNSTEVGCGRRGVWNRGFT